MGCGYRWYWEGRHQSHGLGGEKGKDLGGSSPASSHRLFKEALENLFHFPKPQIIAMFVLRMTQYWISFQQVILGCLSLSFSWLCVKVPGGQRIWHLLKCHPHSACISWMWDGYLRRNNLWVYRFWFLVSLCLHMMTKEEFLEKSLLSQLVTAWSLKLNTCWGYHHIGYCSLLCPPALTRAILPLQRTATKTVFLTAAIIIFCFSCCSCFQSTWSFTPPKPLEAATGKIKPQRDSITKSEKYTLSVFGKWYSKKAPHTHFDLQ